MFKRRTRLGAYVVCQDEDGRILLCLLAPGFVLSGRWTLPGGGVEFGEHPADAALRELHEETGLTGRILDLADVNSRTLTLDRGSGPYELHSVRIVYRVEITGGTLRNEIGGSTERCQWFRPDAVSELPQLDLVALGLQLLREPATS